MSGLVTDIIFVCLAVLAAVGAVTVVFTKDLMRLGLGLGTFLLAVAGVFAWLGFGFLALAQLFVYVGGVLVLILFAVMLVYRTREGRPEVESRHDLLAAISCAGVGALLFVLVRPAVTVRSAAPAFNGDNVDALGGVLLKSMLPQFLLAGVLLLAGLVAVVSIMGGERS